MDRAWWSRVVLILAIALGVVYLLVPSYYDFFVLPKADRNNIKALEDRLPKWMPRSMAKYRLNLGLDLQGGILMVMRVDTKPRFRSESTAEASRSRITCAIKSLARSRRRPTPRLSSSR